MNDSTMQLGEQPRSLMTRTTTEAIPLTRWFKHETHEPGQPGVYEVDALLIEDTGASVSRFAYWNGRAFGPVMLYPNGAYANRFGHRRTDVTVFRGYTEQVAA